MYNREKNYYYLRKHIFFVVMLIFLQKGGEFICSCTSRIIHYQCPFRCRDSANGNGRRPRVAQLLRANESAGRTRESRRSRKRSNKTRTR